MASLITRGLGIDVDSQEALCIGHERGSFLVSLTQFSFSSVSTGGCIRGQGSLRENTALENMRSGRPASTRGLLLSTTVPFLFQFQLRLSVATQGRRFSGPVQVELACAGKSEPV